MPGKQKRREDKRMHVASRASEPPTVSADAAFDARKISRGGDVVDADFSATNLPSARGVVFMKADRLTSASPPFLASAGVAVSVLYEVATNLSPTNWSRICAIAPVAFPAIGMSKSTLTT